MYVNYNLKKTINPKLAKNEGFAKKWDDFSRFTSTYWLQFFVGDLLDETLKREKAAGLGYDSLVKLCDSKAELDAFAYIFQGCERELDELSALANKIFKFLESNVSNFELAKNASHEAMPETINLEELTSTMRSLKLLNKSVKETHFQDPEFCELIDRISEHMISTANKSL